MGSGTSSRLSFAKARELVEKERSLTRQIGSIRGKVESARADIDLAAAGYFENSNEVVSKARAILDRYEDRYERLISERDQIRERLDREKKRRETSDGPRF